MRRTDRVKMLREKAGLTRDQLAQLMNVSRQTVHGWETPGSSSWCADDRLAVIVLLADERTRPMVAQLLRDVQQLGDT